MHIIVQIIKLVVDDIVKCDGLHPIRNGNVEIPDSLKLPQIFKVLNNSVAQLCNNYEDAYQILEVKEGNLFII